jgi:hypothetical protein
VDREEVAYAGVRVLEFVLDKSTCEGGDCAAVCFEDVYPPIEVGR